MQNNQEKINSTSEGDAIDEYFECVTACSTDDQGGECVTECVEVHLKTEMDSWQN